MDEDEARARFAAAQVAILATVSAASAPHVVPVVFAVSKDSVYTAVDTKKKTTHRLQRLLNIEQNPHVSMLANQYADDWEQLWWVRVDGVAQIHDRGEEMATGYDLLRRKYVQYERISLTGPVISISISRWTSWHA